MYNAIRTALGSIANVFMDKALRFGLSFQDLPFIILRVSGELGALIQD